MERKLEKEYPDNPHAVWGTMNKLGLVHGNRETKKGRREEDKHVEDRKKDLAKKIKK